MVKDSDLSLLSEVKDVQSKLHDIEQHLKDGKNLDETQEAFLKQLNIER